MSFEFTTRLVFPAQETENIAFHQRLPDAVEDVRNHWNEEDGPQAFIIFDRSSSVVAMMTRGRDPEICITTYLDGHVEMHRCHYVVNEGEYSHTKVTEVAPCKVCDEVVKETLKGFCADCYRNLQHSEE